VEEAADGNSLPIRKHGFRCDEKFNVSPFIGLAVNARLSFDMVGGGHGLGFLLQQ
jgi:hypothetical protein